MAQSDGVKSFQLDRLPVLHTVPWCGCWCALRGIPFYGGPISKVGPIYIHNITHTHTHIYMYVYIYIYIHTHCVKMQARALPQLLTPYAASGCATFTLRV